MHTQPVIAMMVTATTAALYFTFTEIVRSHAYFKILSSILKIAWRVCLIVYCMHYSILVTWRWPGKTGASPDEHRGTRGSHRVCLDFFATFLYHLSRSISGRQKSRENWKLFFFPLLSFIKVPLPLNKAYNQTTYKQPTTYLSPLKPLNNYAK